MDRADRNRVAETIEIKGLDDPKLAEHVPAEMLAKLREELEMARELLPKFVTGFSVLPKCCITPAARETIRP